jgi:acyl carrier protein
MNSIAGAGASEARVLNAIRRVLGERAEGVGMDDELIAVGLDSMRTIDLLLEIESEFGVQLADEMLTPETFRTPSALHAVVLSLQSENR